MKNVSLQIYKNIQIEIFLPDWHRVILIILNLGGSILTDTEKQLSHVSDM